MIDLNLFVYVHFPVPVPIGRVTVSNVTSTSFHMAWVADLTLHPTFGLTLVSMQRPTVHLDTQNTSLILSGLEPGILHLVEIVAKACGQESARVLLKVRTGNRLQKYLLPFVLKGREKRMKKIFCG